MQENAVSNQTDDGAIHVHKLLYFTSTSNIHMFFQIQQNVAGCIKLTTSSILPTTRA